MKHLWSWKTLETDIGKIVEGGEQLDILDKVIGRKWNNITKDELEVLFYEKELTIEQIAELFQVKESSVVHKLNKYNLNEQEKLLYNMMKSQNENVKKAMIQQAIMDEALIEDPSELEYGPIIVTRGKYKGRIGCYDDEEGQTAYVYWGDMVETLDTCVTIRKSYLSNKITTYDFVQRGRTLINQIAHLRSKLQYVDENISTYRDITELYGEYTYVMALLNRVYEETFYLQGRGKRIFISHSSADKQLALYLASNLKKANFEVWFDMWNLQLGHSIPKGISDGLDSADTLLIILSKNYLNSAFCNDEWEAFYMKFRDKPIMVIIVDESEPPTILCGKKYYRMKDITEYDTMFRELRRALAEKKK